MIPFFDLREQYQTLELEIHQALQGVLSVCEFILGSPVRELEARLAEYCGVGHALGVASGTDALRLALAALDVGAGDEVITTPFTYVATASAISQSGATPVFVDTDASTFNLDPGLVRAAITGRTKAILPVHLFGEPADMEPILRLAREHGLAVIEDCAQAIGGIYGGRSVGSLGDVGCFSFYPTKNLGAYGDAGLVTTRDARLAERLDLLRRQGAREKYHSEFVGFNSRLDSMQAAILLVKLKRLDAWNARRRELASRYTEALGDLPVQLPLPHPGHVFHQYTLATSRRDELAAFLSQRGVGTQVYYPVPLHRQRLYASLGYAEGSLPVSERLAREVLSLPIYPELSQASQDFVITAIRDFFASPARSAQ